MFYMSLRYDGSDSNTEDLQLSDCPCACAFKLGLLHDLLVWHAEDAVDDAELARNEGICSSYQNNRNPFIDFPELASLFFASVDSPNPCPPCDCSDDDMPIDDDMAPPDYTDAFFSPGDVAIVGFNSDTSAKGITFAVLVDVPPGASFTVTDHGWEGTLLGFRSTEGSISYVVGPDGLTSGTVLYWDDAEAAPNANNGEWTLNGQFNPAATGDNLLIYEGILPFFFPFFFPSLL
jgi:hypothetical protein